MEKLYQENCQAGQVLFAEVKEVFTENQEVISILKDAKEDEKLYLILLLASLKSK